MRTRPQDLVAAGVAMAALALAGPAAAEADSEYVREGTFLSLAGVYALANTGQDYRNKDDTGGAHARFGMRIVPPVAIGVYGEWLNWEGNDTGSFGAFLKIFPVEAFGTSLAEGVVQPYLFGGAGGTWRSSSAGGDFRGGGGVDIYVSENAVLFGEVHYSGAGGDASGLESTNFLAGFSWRY